MQKRDWQEYSSKAILAAVLMAFAYLFLKYAAFLILPFAIAFLLSLPISYLARRCVKLGGPYKLWAGFYCACAWALTFAALPIAAQKLIGELEELVRYLCTDQKTEAIAEKIDRILSGIPVLSLLKNEGGTSDLLSGLLQKLGGAIESFAIKALGRAAMALPRIAVGGFVCVAASFYFCFDAELLRERISSLDTGIKGILHRVLFALRAYAKTYFILFIMTFAMLYAGLLALGREYALSIAFITAVLDVLPLIGTGIVLVPWAIFLILGGQSATGIGMLVLFLLINLSHRVAESKLISSEFGIHPLLSLAAMYVGMSLFGFFGMISLPVMLLVLRELFSKQAEKEKSKETK